MVRTMMLGLAVIAGSLGATAKSADAPADEYFGRFKYSAISVRTKIDALGRSYHERWADDASIVHDAGLVEDSLRAWAQKYPKDRWIAPTAYHLAQLYQIVQTQDARNHARTMYQFVAQAVPTSKEAHIARLRLQQGFPALHDESGVSPTPSPYGAQPAASGSPNATAPAASPPPGSSGVPVPPSPAATAPSPASPPATAPAPGSSIAPSAAPAPATVPAAPGGPLGTPAPRPSPGR